VLFSLNDIDKKKKPVQEEVISGHLKDVDIKFSAHDSFLKMKESCFGDNF
jgi:hypothetical protein